MVRRRRSLTAALLAAALLAAAPLAGCGGDDDSGPQTKEGFIAAADGVCEDLFSEFSETTNAAPRTPQEIADANQELADLYGKLSSRLSDVRLPDSGAARRQAQRFIASVRAAEPTLVSLRAASKRFVAAAKAGDKQAVARTGTEVRTALDNFRAARADSDRLAVEYGLNFCGNLG